jgi:hypothetical protein
VFTEQGKSSSTTGGVTAGYAPASSAPSIEPSVARAGASARAGTPARASPFETALSKGEAARPATTAKGQSIAPGGESPGVLSTAGASRTAPPVHSGEAVPSTPAGAAPAGGSAAPGQAAAGKIIESQIRDESKRGKDMIEDKYRELQQKGVNPNSPDGKRELDKLRSDHDKRMADLNRQKNQIAEQIRKAGLGAEGDTVMTSGSAQEQQQFMKKLKEKGIETPGAETPKTEATKASAGKPAEAGRPAVMPQTSGHEQPVVSEGQTMPAQTMPTPVSQIVNRMDSLRKHDEEIFSKKSKEQGVAVATPNSIYIDAMRNLYGNEGAARRVLEIGSTVKDRAESELRSNPKLKGKDFGTAANYVFNTQVNQILKPEEITEIKKQEQVYAERARKVEPVGRFISKDYNYGTLDLNPVGIAQMANGALFKEDLSGLPTTPVAAPKTTPPTEAKPLKPAIPVKAEPAAREAMPAASTQSTTSVSQVAPEGQGKEGGSAGRTPAAGEGALPVKLESGRYVLRKGKLVRDDNPPPGSPVASPGSSASSPGSSASSPGSSASSPGSSASSPGSSASSPGSSASSPGSSASSPGSSASSPPHLTSDSDHRIGLPPLREPIEPPLPDRLWDQLDDDRGRFDHLNRVGVWYDSEKNVLDAWKQAIPDNVKNRPEVRKIIEGREADFNVMLERKKVGAMQAYTDELKLIHTELELDLNKIRNEEQQDILKAKIRDTSRAIEGATDFGSALRSLGELVDAHDQMEAVDEKLEKAKGYKAKTRK